MANAKCAICGKDYEVCNSCLEQKTFKPWRTVTESIEHYKIYSAIHGYTITKNKEVAKTALQNCNLSGQENFLPEIRAVIKEIIADSRAKKSLKKGNTEVETRKQTDEFCE